jgi:hypothetical protein
LENATLFVAMYSLRSIKIVAGKLSMHGQETQREPALSACGRITRRSRPTSCGSGSAPRLPHTRYARVG